MATAEQAVVRAVNSETMAELVASDVVKWGNTPDGYLELTVAKDPGVSVVMLQVHITLADLTAVQLPITDGGH